MANVIIFEGQGTTISDGTVTLAAKSIELPLGSNAAIDVTNLSNEAVKTKVLATLQETNEFSVSAEFHTDYIGLSRANREWTITLPSSGGTFKVWAAITEMGNPNLETDNQPTIDITFTPTNRNGSGVETAPVYAAAS